MPITITICNVCSPKSVNPQSRIVPAPIPRHYRSAYTSLAPFYFLIGNGRWVPFPSFKELTENITQLPRPLPPFLLMRKRYLYWRRLKYAEKPQVEHLGTIETKGFVTRHIYGMGSSPTPPGAAHMGSFPSLCPLQRLSLVQKVRSLRGTREGIGYKVTL